MPSRWCAATACEHSSQRTARPAGIGFALSWSADRSDGTTTRGNVGGAAQGSLGGWGLAGEASRETMKEALNERRERR